MDETAEAGFCEEYSQGTKVEDISRTYREHISWSCKVFYTNLLFYGDSLVSHVKGVDMIITSDVWSAVTGLKSSGLRINRGNLGVVEDSNIIHFYKGSLKNPHSKVRNFSVGGLKLDERLVAFIVSWILTPRGSNHSTLSEEDLLLIYCIMNKVKINWIHTIKEWLHSGIVNGLTEDCVDQEWSKALKNPNPSVWCKTEVAAVFRIGSG